MSDTRADLRQPSEKWKSQTSRMTDAVAPILRTASHQLAAGPDMDSCHFSMDTIGNTGEVNATSLGRVGGIQVQTWVGNLSR